MSLTFTETPLYYRDAQGQYKRILSGSDMTGYRTAAAQDAIDAGLVSAAAAQSLTAAQQAQARENIGAASEWVLLWENASPSSAFAAQTISLDLSGYAFLLVDANRVGSANDYNSIVVPNLIGYKFLLGSVIGTNSLTNRYRFFTVVSGGLYADNGVANVSGSEDLSYIPWHIYGIKG